jgi:hypothetical protein
MELLELPKVMPIDVRSLGSGPALVVVSLIVAGRRYWCSGKGKVERAGRRYLSRKSTSSLGVQEDLVGVAKNSRSKIWAFTKSLSLGLSAPLLWSSLPAYQYLPKAT